MREHAVWIAWEKQRRTTELARILDVPLVRMLDGGPYAFRVLVVAFKTLQELRRRRPSVVIVQNPSVVLAAMVCAVKMFMGFRVIVDRHSNFKFATRGSWNPKYRIFHALSGYSLRRADLTIVTNEFLAEVVRREGGRAHVLPDAIPALRPRDKIRLGPGGHILYVSSFDHDEPLELVIEAARIMGPDATIHISGNHHRADPDLLESAPENVRFLGFVDEQVYVDMMDSVDVVLTLTTQPHTLQCGAYEAVALGKPLVFADHDDMRRHFRRGAVVAALDPGSLATALGAALDQRTRLEGEVRELREELEREWLRDFSILEAAVRDVAGG